MQVNTTYYICTFCSLKVRVLQYEPIILVFVNIGMQDLCKLCLKRTNNITFVTVYILQRL